MLSALAWNYRQLQSPDNPTATDAVYSKRRRCWVLRNRAGGAGLAQQLPMLMDSVLSVLRGYVSLPWIARPAAVEVGAQVTRPAKEELVAARATRFMQQLHRIIICDLLSQNQAELTPSDLSLAAETCSWVSLCRFFNFSGSLL